MGVNLLRYKKCNYWFGFPPTTIKKLGWVKGEDIAIFIDKNNSEILFECVTEKLFSDSFKKRLKNKEFTEVAGFDYYKNQYIICLPKKVIEFLSEGKRKRFKIILKALPGHSKILSISRYFSKKGG